MRKTNSVPLYGRNEMTDSDEAIIENYRATIKPVAYLMENDESKWLDWEPDPCADFITPLYKEKWKVAK